MTLSGASPVCRTKRPIASRTKIGGRPIASRTKIGGRPIASRTKIGGQRPRNRGVEKPAAEIG
ncbi:hypothetical protein ARTHRO9AX_180413 [Arthrobacter sp. 9AX]|nr:hypothetical protein ARTHRO9AX_180413 [Arthrobacter sp. 9AX]